MNKEQTIYNECLSVYQSIYESSFKELSEEAHKESKSLVLSDSKEKEIETTAQKKAIMQSMIQGRVKFPNDIALVWHSIYKAHIFRKSGISDLKTIVNVISADQSWKKSSGHAFEDMIKFLGTIAMSGTNVEYILQRDLNILIKAGELDNQPRDISWLKEQIKGNIFDLYTIVKKNGKTFCFGCVQAKTSIRDRVTRDREPSIHAMDSNFWSVIFVLDGDYLKNAKFRNMVNGGTQEFPTNGWHGMYDFSGGHEENRIYTIDLDLDIIKLHTLRAVDAWLNQRQWLDRDWIIEPNIKNNWYDQKIKELALKDTSFLDAAKRPFDK